MIVFIGLKWAKNTHINQNLKIAGSAVSEKSENLKIEFDHEITTCLRIESDKDF